MISEDAKRTETGSTWRARRAARRAALGFAAAALAMALSIGSAAACQPASYCNDRGACLTIAQVKQQVDAQFGPQGYSVARIRLQGHAPTPTCLWYEVQLQSRAGGSTIVYWDIRGGRAG